MGCPRCGNRDIEKTKPRISYEHRDKWGRGSPAFIGYECLRCGHNWNASPGTVLRDFDPPKVATPEPQEEKL